MGEDKDLVVAEAPPASFIDRLDMKVENSKVRGTRRACKLAWPRALGGAGVSKARPSLEGDRPTHVARD